MNQDAALELFREQLVTMTGLADGVVFHGPLDTPAPVSSWMVLTPLAERGRGRPRRSLTVVHQAREVDVVVSAHGATAVAGLLDAHASLLSDSQEATSALDNGVATGRVGPVSQPNNVNRTAFEPVATFTVTLSYNKTVSQSAPASATSIAVDLHDNDGPTREDVITISIGA